MRSPRRFLLLVILLGVLLGPSRTAVPASAPDDICFPITEHTLGNGMRFLIVERHDSPTLAAYLRVQVGSVNERPRLTGLAHLLGHMMFKGTTPFGALDPERGLPILGKIDARYRVLLAEKAKGRLPGGTADAAAVAALEGETAALEGEAGQSILPSELWEICRGNGGVRLNASTSRESTQYFVSLPSNRLELCALLESGRMRIPVFREFFRTHYAPNRVLAALVGDLDPAAAIRTVERYFGSIPAQPIPPLLPLEEPPQTGERRIRVEFPAEPRLLMLYPSPPIGHPDTHAPSVLGSLQAMAARRDWTSGPRIPSNWNSTGIPPTTSTPCSTAMAASRLPRSSGSPDDTSIPTPPQSSASGILRSLSPLCARSDRCIVRG